MIDTPKGLNIGNSFRNWKEGLASSTFLFLSALFIRLPFFFRDYIDRDESTFILMGQSVADGHLPYVHLWDLKPPLLFYIFGAIEYILPHSFEAIRFTAVLVVCVSAVLLVSISKRAGFNNGFITGLLYIVLSSEFGNLQGLMSEHLAVMFMLLGVYFFQAGNNLNWVLAGIWFGCALLCKLSFAYAVAALFLFYMLFNRKQPLRDLLIAGILMGSGILLVLLVLAIPYFRQDQLDIFISSVFLAPLEYGNAQHLSFLQKLGNTWWVALLGILVSSLAWRKRNTGNYFIIGACMVILLGTTYTFLSSGIINGHYMVQVYPFLLLLIMGVIIPSFKKPKYWVLTILLIILSLESILEYNLVIKSIQSKGHPYYRQSFNIAGELKKRQLDKEKIFFADYHIGYWLLRQYPLTKSTTHPSNLSRPYLFPYMDARSTSFEELRFLMDSVRPEIIVSKYPVLGFFPRYSLENLYFDSVIKADFRSIYSQPKKGVYIWKRESSNVKR